MWIQSLFGIENNHQFFNIHGIKDLCLEKKDVSYDIDYKLQCT